MAAPPQTVIYRLDEAYKPEWQFHSMPESAVGGGNTLDEAREEYRDALRFLLDTDQLPEIREYIEREAHVGIWVRTLLGDPHGDAQVQEIGHQIASYPPEDLDGFFYRNPTAGGDPVVFHGGPNDPLVSIFRQMTPFDSLILMAGVGDGGPKPQKLMWLVIAGTEASVDRDESLPGLGELGLTLESPLSEVFAAVWKHHQRYGDPRSHANRLPALLAPA
ncbi:MAG: hypothetical protein ACLP3C_21505 [Mycobacterium sp.]|uniref:hypothetical protein n=1 Tax=Mycobacterium sp. TaxID=1785 RepID=UPI003F9C1984